MVEKEETDRLMRTARVRSRGLDEIYKEGDYPGVVKEAYNIMFTAARATLNHLGASTMSQRAVASAYRKEIIGRQLINRKYQDHLRKIHNYREEVLSGEGEMEPERVEKIIDACKDFVKILGKVIKDNPEPIIEYDIGDFA
jgi:uncharacterized protein (UPF0332 family)